MWYLISLSPLYAATYLALFFGIPIFFNAQAPRISRRSIFSIISIVATYFIVLTVSLSITASHPEFGNRILHSVGGGALVVLTCFFAIKDNLFKIKIFQFFVIGILVATFLGVGNEIAEFILQDYFAIISAESINDTWLDLVSNAVGATLATLCLLPFFRLYKNPRSS